MKLLIAIILILGGCSYIFDLVWTLYLTFSNNVKQDNYGDRCRDFDTMFLLIPAMNEFQSLRKNIPYLMELQKQCESFIKLKLVFIDDDSSDGTTTLLEKYAYHPNVIVVHRVKPNAQQGKGPALEEAAERIAKMNYSEDKTIIGVIDADSHLDANYLRQVVYAFDHSNCDLLQTRVNIYNLDHNIAAMQNFEFTIYNSLLQMARTYWGSSLASGNGQFMTLKMTNNVGWSSSLLEDCEFSLKGLLKSYHGTFLNTVSIGQEGVTKYKKLIKQRTRWCQGGFQCLGKYGKRIIKSKFIPSMVKTFVLLFLLIPVLSMVTTPASAISLIVLLLYVKTNAWISISIIASLLVIEYLTNTMLILKQYREARFDEPLKTSYLLKILFLIDFYRWSLAIVPYKALGRILVGNQSWSKTSHT
ncbi:glycosyltransferase family 2 protein [Lactobacillus kimbladii]|uniref:glycosyltransferase family 2 protein n=1 Tax=Lactobacillus kimbladii TaxID=1218506 RepID=UPI003AF5A68A